MNKLTFNNEVISITDIPDYESIPLQPIEKKYTTVVHYNTIIWFSIFLVISLLLFYFNATWQRMFIIVIVSIFFVVALGVTVFLNKKSLQIKAYAIRQKDILYKTGWLFTKTHVVPYHKIQHCAVSIGPIEKKIGLASLKIYTAASENTDITIRGLTISTAEQLKDWLMQNNTLHAATH